MSREDDARRFAEVIPRWEYRDQIGFDDGIAPGFIIEHGEHGQGYEETLALPCEADDLSTHLAFVGRVVEVVGARCWSAANSHVEASLFYVHLYDVGGHEGHWQSTAPDPSYAAMLAAIAAKEGR